MIAVIDCALSFPDTSLVRVAAVMSARRAWMRSRRGKRRSQTSRRRFDRSVVLLDVREDDEWQRGHAPGAQHIPMGQIPARLDEIDPNAKLFVVCQAGGRSRRVSQYLARNGYTPVNVNGGMSPALRVGGAPRPGPEPDGP